LLDRALAGGDACVERPSGEHFRVVLSLGGELQVFGVDAARLTTFVVDVLAIGDWSDEMQPRRSVRLVDASVHGELAVFLVALHRALPYPAFAVSWVLQGFCDLLEESGLDWLPVASAVGFDSMQVFPGTFLPVMRVAQRLR